MPTSRNARCSVRTMADAVACPSHARRIAHAAGFSAIDCEKIAIAASELATNIVRHASHGFIRIGVLDDPRGVELVAEDEGPGIEDVHAAMSDGYSQGRVLGQEQPVLPSGGLGAGLGAVSRLMDDFEVETVPQQGTRIRAFKKLGEPSKATNHARQTLILGLGNSILTDDGIGIHVIRKLAEGTLPEGVTLAEAEVAGFSLLDLLEGFDLAVVVDAVKIAGREPGDVVVIEADELPSLHLVAGHQIDLPTALELGRRLGRPLPSAVHVVGVQIVDDRTFGEWPTPDVARAIPTAARIALKLASKNR